MNNAKVFTVISGIALVMAFATIVVVGLEMEQVRQWRMNGESTKANLLILNRMIITGALLGSSYLALYVSDLLGGNKQSNLTPVYDRTMES